MDTVSYDIKRLDHLGVVAGTIRDLGIVELIDKIFGTDKREEISIGESIAGMVINGLGFTSQPLSLTERFFNKKPLELLFGRNDIESKYFNRNKLSKTLDKIYDYGCEKLFYQISLAACSKANISLRCSSLDTTSISVTGEYDKDSDENSIKVTHGFSKDHRSDLKQCVHELLVSQDGGVPLMMKSYSGNSPDSKIFKERTKMLIANFKASNEPRYLIADGKLYCSANAENLSQIKFITRISSTLSIVKDAIFTAFSNNNNWVKINKEDKYTSVTIEHYGINQRWLIVKTVQSESRARKRIIKVINKEYEDYTKKIKDFSKFTFSSKEEAIANLEILCSKLQYHKLLQHNIIVSELDGKNIYSILGSLCKDPAKEQYNIMLSSCFVIGTNIDALEINDFDVIKLYKNQNIAIENTGFRFLKDPKFFTQSFFIKKPERIEALLFVMTLALLIYSIAQRHLRQEMEKQQKEVPNQINKATRKPTLRWVFQLLEDIHVLYRKIDNKIELIIDGFLDLKQKIIGFFSNSVQDIYHGKISYCA